MSTASFATGIDFDALKDAVHEKSGLSVASINLIGKDEICRSYNVTLADGSDVIARVAPSSMRSILESELASIKYIANNTSIPVPRIVGYNFDAMSPGPYIITQKIDGVSLESVFTTLTPFQRHNIVAQVAKWMLDIFGHRFDHIGSFILRDEEDWAIGPVTRPVFYLEGRAQLDLERGPFGTSKAYYFACAQRELDSSRILFAQDASPDYQRDVEEMQLQVERSVGLMFELVSRCRGLDEDDPQLAPFSIDLHKLSLKNVFVSEDDPSQIICVSGWQSIMTAPLWRCARLPAWLRPSLSDAGEQEKTTLSNVFKKVILQLEGPESLFLRALDLDDTRHALDDLSEYDAVRDGFLILPTLESILATLPGQEDVDGLSALLDPSTLVGRVARINLVTRGSNAMFLAMPQTENNGTGPTRQTAANVALEISS